MINNQTTSLARIGNSFVALMIAVCMSMNFSCDCLAQSDESDNRDDKFDERQFYLFQEIESAIDNEEMSKSLAIVSSQREALKVILDAFDEEAVQNIFAARREISEIIQDPSLSSAEKTKRKKQIVIQLSKQNNTIQEANLPRLKRILLPGQFEILERMALTEYLDNKLYHGGFTAFKDVFDLLGIEEDKAREVEAMTKDVQKEYEEELAKLRKEFEQKATKALPINSQKKLKELFGEWYYFGQ